MKNLLFTGLMLAVSGSVCAQSYQISSKIDVNEQTIGSPVLIVNAGELANISVADKYSVSVLITPESASQVLLNLATKEGEMTRSTELSLPLDKKVELEIGKQSFELLINKVQ
ncbi:hypothetical protein HII17_00650 [Thalassotalea sp. M1531]|uniref:Pilus formation protein N-terminal domain-containing protein n=1 Tax=Thalassotalea algicola TaxID=2716224 RepID=A0A7Y0LBK2_9GAMM|nr:hypothetical protein [Thalassotalea algicola]NMP30055.1 hypothetical protein [Thalassotalea algicola]